MGQIFYWARAREGLLKLKYKSVQHVKETVEQFGHVNVSALSSAKVAKALSYLGKVAWRLGAGCLHQCRSPPVSERQSMLLSPTQENLAPQAWAIKRVRNCREFVPLHRQDSRGKSDCEKAEESRKDNPGISQDSIAFSSSTTTLASSLLNLYGLTRNYYH